MPAIEPDKELLSRTQLYHLVWSKPNTHLADELGISYTQLKQACRKMNIPLPSAGHWTRLRFGKSFPRPELPPSKPGDDIEIDLTALKQELRIKQERVVPGGQQINDALLPPIPERLSDQHKLVAEAKQSLLRKREYSPQYGLMDCEPGRLNIKVTAANANRALIFMNMFLTEVYSRGYDIINKERETFAVIYGHEIKICFRERLKKVLVKSSYSDRLEQTFVPSGVVYFKLDSFETKEWQDNKLRLEHQIPAIIQRLESVAEEKHKMKLRSEQWLTDYNEKERLKKDRLELIEQELHKLRSLLQCSDRFQTVTNLRNYISEIEKRKRNEVGELPNEINQWVEWAKQKANWYDPFLEVRDELFKNIERNNFEIDKDAEGL